MLKIITAKVVEVYDSRKDLIKPFRFAVKVTSSNGAFARREKDKQSSCHHCRRNDKLLNLMSSTKANCQYCSHIEQQLHLSRATSCFIFHFCYIHHTTAHPSGLYNGLVSRLYFSSKQKVCREETDFRSIRMEQVC